MAALQTIHLLAEEVVIKAAIINIIIDCIAKMTCCNLISGKVEREGSPELSSSPPLFRLLSAFCFGTETQLEFFPQDVGF